MLLTAQHRDRFSCLDGVVGRVPVCSHREQAAALPEQAGCRTVGDELGGQPVANSSSTATSTAAMRPAAAG